MTKYCISNYWPWIHDTCFMFYWCLTSLMWRGNYLKSQHYGAACPLERWGLKSPASPLFTQPFIQAQIKERHQSSVSLAFVRGIHRWPVNSPHKWPVTRKMFPFDDVIMIASYLVLFDWRGMGSDIQSGFCQSWVIHQVIPEATEPLLQHGGLGHGQVVFLGNWVLHLLSNVVIVGWRQRLHEIYICYYANPSLTKRPKWSRLSFLHRP